MNKSLLLLVIALVCCSFALKTQHDQKFAPSTPGGTTQTNSTVTPLINGQPYYFSGPFTLACWLPSNTQVPYRFDTCYTSQTCYQLLVDYKNCYGTVKKYPPIAWWSLFKNIYIVYYTKIFNCTNHCIFMQ
jgi:hypothetical protein